MLPPLLRYAAVTGSFALWLVLEHFYPLRKRAFSQRKRLWVNLGLAIVGGLAVAFAFSAIVVPSSNWAEREHVGFVRWLPLPRFLKVSLSLVLLDYTLWMWHWLNHRVPLLWRFHAAHHTDIDLDVSTAVRFHFGELLLSIPYRTAQVIVIGVDLPMLFAWEVALMLFVQFHHSNTRLPFALEAQLRRFVITPRVHGIHHSVVPSEVNSNFGSILSLWDFVHGTHRWGIEQARITIGIRGLLRFAGLEQTLALPFSSRAPSPPAHETDPPG